MIYTIYTIQYTQYTIHNIQHKCLIKQVSYITHYTFYIKVLEYCVRVRVDMYINVDHLLVLYQIYLRIENWEIQGKNQRWRGIYRIYIWNKGGKVMNIIFHFSFFIFSFSLFHFHFHFHCLCLSTNITNITFITFIFPLFSKFFSIFYFIYHLSLLTKYQNLKLAL